VRTLVFVIKLFSRSYYYYYYFYFFEICLERFHPHGSRAHGVSS